MIRSGPSKGAIACIRNVCALIFPLPSHLGVIPSVDISPNKHINNTVVQWTLNRRFVSNCCLPATPPVHEATPELFENAFHHAAIGMALVGLDGRWLVCKPSAC